jgi:hypothetical protein
VLGGCGIIKTEAAIGLREKQPNAQANSPSMTKG